jgi:hypothetical protein
VKPDLNPLLAVTNRLDKARIPYALGGSGLLYALDLTDTVRDWDVMTDSSKEKVRDALEGLDVTDGQCGDYPYATEYKFAVYRDDPQVEVIGRFAIHHENGLCRLPVIPTTRWKGVYVGSAEVWFVAYSLMDRQEKAKALLSGLNKNGADQEALQQMLKQPLPASLQRELELLFNE